MYYRWGEGDLLFPDTGGEYVTSLSIGLVTLGGVSALALSLVMCMHEGAQTQTLPPPLAGPSRGQSLQSDWH